MHTTHFRDFDAFAGSVRDIDCTMMLRNPSHRKWTISRANLSGIHVQLGRLGSGNIVEGRSFSTGYVLYLPLTDTCAYSANGTVLDKGSFMICEPGCEFCISTKFEHDWCSIYIPSDKLARTKAMASQSSGTEKMICRASRPNRPVAHRFKALVDQVMTAATYSPQFESSAASVGAAAQLLKIGSLVVADHRQVAEADQIGRQKISRQQIIRRSEELLEEHGGEPVRAEELAAAAQVSERTLRTAFQEYFGMGPASLLRLRRLHEVHRELRAADPEAVQVANVLIRHGVYDFGRFASRYRLLFGELPSETLHRKRRQQIIF